MLHDQSERVTPKGALRNRRQGNTSSTSAQRNSTHDAPSRTPPTLRLFTSSDLRYAAHTCSHLREPSRWRREEDRRCRAGLFLGRQNCARDWLSLTLCTKELTCVGNCADRVGLSCVRGHTAAAVPRKDKMVNNRREILVEDGRTMFSKGEHDHRGISPSQ
jgi:hypothetical protein